MNEEPKVTFRKKPGLEDTKRGVCVAYTGGTCFSTFLKVFVCLIPLSKVEAVESDVNSYSWRPWVIHAADFGAESDDEESLRPDGTGC